MMMMLELMSQRRDAHPLMTKYHPMVTNEFSLSHFLYPTAKRMHKGEKRVDVSFFLFLLLFFRSVLDLFGFCYGWIEREREKERQRKRERT